MLSRTPGCKLNVPSVGLVKIGVPLGLLTANHVGLTVLLVAPIRQIRP